MKVFNVALIMCVLTSYDRLLPADLQQQKHVSDLELLVTNARYDAAARKEPTNQLINSLYVMPRDIVSAISEHIMSDPTKTAYPFTSLRQKVDWLPLSKCYARKYEQDIRDATAQLWYSHGYTQDECARALHRYNYWVRHENIIGHIQTNNLNGLKSLVNLCQQHNKYINWNYNWCAYHDSGSKEVHSFLQRAILRHESHELLLYVLGQGANPALVSDHLFTFNSHKEPMRCLLLHGLRPPMPIPSP